MRDATTRRSESTQHNEPLGAGTGTTRREAWVRVRRRRPPALSLALYDRLRKIASRSLRASGSPALANRLRAHCVRRSNGVDRRGGATKQAAPRRRQPEGQGRLAPSLDVARRQRSAPQDRLLLAP